VCNKLCNNASESRKFSARESQGRGRRSKSAGYASGCKSNTETKDVQPAVQPKEKTSAAENQQLNVHTRRFTTLPHQGIHAATEAGSLLVQLSVQLGNSPAILFQRRTARARSLKTAVFPVQRVSFIESRSPSSSMPGTPPYQQKRRTI